MTREEALEELKEIRFNLNYKVNGTSRFDEALDMAIKALEKEPCEDAVSRQAVLAIAGDSCLDLDSYEDTREFCDEIKALPSVTSQPMSGYISIDDAMSAFDDFMCNDIEPEGQEVFLELLKDRAERSEE